VPDQVLNGIGLGAGAFVGVGTTQYTCDGTSRRRRDVPSVFTPTAQPQLTFSEAPVHLRRVIGPVRTGQGCSVGGGVGTAQYICDGTDRRRRDESSVFTPTAQAQFASTENAIEPVTLRIGQGSMALQKARLAPKPLLSARTPL